MPATTKRTNPAPAALVIPDELDVSKIRKGNRFLNLHHLAEYTGFILPDKKLTKADYENITNMLIQYLEWETLPNSHEIIITKKHRNKKDLSIAKLERYSKKKTPLIDLTGVNCSKLQKGMIFNNISDLAKAVNTPLPSMPSKENYDALYNLWKPYFSWEKIDNGRRIKITDIYVKTNFLDLASKADNICIVDLFNVKEGMIFKNAKELGETIGVPIKNGRYEDAYAIWSKYFKWEKIPNSRAIKITNVDKRRVKRIDSDNLESVYNNPHAKYKNELTKIVLHLLNTEPDKPLEWINYTLDIYYNLLGLWKGSFDVESINSLCRQNNITLTEKECIILKSNLYTKFAITIKNVLEYLKKRRIIDYSYGYHCFKDDSFVRFVEDKDPEGECIKEIIIKSRIRYIKTQELIQIYADYDAAFRAIKIRLIDSRYEDEKFILSDEELDKCKKIINEQVINGLLKRVKK